MKIAESFLKFITISVNVQDDSCSEKIKSSLLTLFKRVAVKPEIIHC